jgi:hypothetical protein
MPAPDGIAVEGTLPEMPNDHFGKSQFWQMTIFGK